MYLKFLIIFRNYRNSNKPITHNGKISLGSIRAVQLSIESRWTCRSDKQKIMARNHQRTSLNVEHYIGGFYPTYTVSI